MTPQRVAFGKVWMVEVIRRIMSHAKFFHHTAGTRVRRNGERNEGGKLEKREAMAHGGLRTFGGQLIFGTDVGYMTDYSTDGEFVELGKSGLDWKDILAMLTTNPAARMGASRSKGTVTPGKLADLTVLSADPAMDLTNFARVQMVIRSGRVISAK